MDIYLFTATFIYAVVNIILKMVFFDIFKNRESLLRIMANLLEKLPESAKNDSAVSKYISDILNGIKSGNVGGITHKIDIIVERFGQIKHERPFEAPEQDIKNIRLINERLKKKETKGAKPESEQGISPIRLAIATIFTSLRVRGRGIIFTIDVAKRLGFDLKSWFKERAKLGMETGVLEIGCGEGHALDDLKRLGGNHVKTYGIDLEPWTKWHARGIDNYIQGDALKVKFPKADFIFSFYALGYIGHPNLMVEKIAEALKSGGKAVLHFNTRWGGYQTLLPGAEKYFDGLRQQGITRTPNTRVKVIWFDPQKVWRGWRDIRGDWVIGGDWFVLIEKAG